MSRGKKADAPVSAIPKEVWERAERDMLRREVNRLFRLGRIRPVWKTPPQMMDKVDGHWVARLGYSV